MTATLGEYDQLRPQPLMTNISWTVGELFSLHRQGQLKPRHLLHGAPWPLERQMGLADSLRTGLAIPALVVNHQSQALYYQLVDGLNRWESIRLFLEARLPASDLVLFRDQPRQQLVWFHEPLAADLERVTTLVANLCPSSQLVHRYLDRKQRENVLGRSLPAVLYQELPDSDVTAMVNQWHNRA